MKLLEQVHGDEGQQAVLGCADGVALVLPGDGVPLLLVGPMAGHHRPPPPAGPPGGATGLRRALRRVVGGRVPASARVARQQLAAAVLHPVEALHPCTAGPLLRGPWLLCAPTLTIFSFCRDRNIKLLLDDDSGGPNGFRPLQEDLQAVRDGVEGQTGPRDSWEMIKSTADLLNESVLMSVLLNVSLIIIYHSRFLL